MKSSDNILLLIFALLMHKQLLNCLGTIFGTMSRVRQIEWQVKNALKFLKGCFSGVLYAFKINHSKCVGNVFAQSLCEWSICLDWGLVRLGFRFILNWSIDSWRKNRAAWLSRISFYRTSYWSIGMLIISPELLLNKLVKGCRQIDLLVFANCTLVLTLVPLIFILKVNEVGATSCDA